MMTVGLVNHRNPHIAMLALALLDTLVQQCGYPFHLQIATKEFLNELVRRFPERPPPFPGPVMTRILELIHGWKEGICTDSRWREDLGNIRDMHRLLTFKGYRFRDMPRQQNLTNATVSSISVEFGRIEVGCWLIQRPLFPRTLFLILQFRGRVENRAPFYFECAFFMEDHTRLCFVFLSVLFPVRSLALLSDIFHHITEPENCGGVGE